MLWIFERECLPVEEPLGQGGNERDLDDKPHQRFKGSEHREGIVKRDIVPWKEATTVEARHAEHKSSERRERWPNGMAKKIVGCGEAGNDEKVGEKAAAWFVTVACDEKKEPGKEPRPQELQTLFQSVP